ncbi:hypothetical protein MLD38_004144 [Melastoma candidum]|uniref:Uncharacterized protein n=1 Tax=Melastoma candidum TaxID=119954 RepID=A0ACB9S4X3_9MYRT|nr:hypothetical protein MLD38_004144 [Melastoma candidum]
MLAVRNAARTRLSCFSFPSLNHSLSTAAALAPHGGTLDSDSLFNSFRDYFNSGKNSLFDRIFDTLSSTRHDLDLFPADKVLSQLDIRLSERFVLDVLCYGQQRHKDVLSCLRFFDWAGRQPGFYHTRVTFSAIFKILSFQHQSKIILDFLDDFAGHKGLRCLRFYDMLVMGYAMAGKPDLALQLFGRMRFLGIDLDSFVYHVILNSLVEERCYDAVRVVASQIKLQGLECEVTHAIMVKFLCLQKRMEDARVYFSGLRKEKVNARLLGTYVTALCEDGKFEEAGSVVEEFRNFGVKNIEHVYDVWLGCIIRAGKLDGALEFYQGKKYVEGYIPDVFRYNMLISRLLGQNRLYDVSDLFMDMLDLEVPHDKFTYTAALCYFCKKGMIDAALKLFECRVEFGLSPMAMAYNYLINTLCGNSTDMACRVLKNSIEQGYFPRRRTFNLLTEALCSDRKMAAMRELAIAALERNLMPDTYVYDKFISALCESDKVEEGYLLLGDLNKANKRLSRLTFSKLIHGFNKLQRGDMSAKLLLEMQDKGYVVKPQLIRSVTRTLCEMKNPRAQFLKFLENYLDRAGASATAYNHFIHGAGNAKRPGLAREVYDIMVWNGVKPNRNSGILLLQSYLKNGSISDAIKIFNQTQQKVRVETKTFNALIVGLCKAGRDDLAAYCIWQMVENDLIPGKKSYEDLVHLYCKLRKYYDALNLISNMEKLGRKFTTFIGNILLLHCTKSPELYDAWIDCFGEHDEKSTAYRNLLGYFSGKFEADNVDHVLEWVHQCFRPDIYTYNLILRKIGMRDADAALEFFKEITQIGHKPNEWTHTTIAQILRMNGRVDEAERWVRLAS